VLKIQAAAKERIVRTQSDEIRKFMRDKGLRTIIGMANRVVC
jgi:hypothetical protein